MTEFETKLIQQLDMINNSHQTLCELKALELSHFGQQSVAATEEVARKVEVIMKTHNTLLNESARHVAEGEI